MREEDWYGPNDGEVLVLFYIRYTAGAGRPGCLSVSVHEERRLNGWAGDRKEGEQLV